MSGWLAVAEAQAQTGAPGGPGAFGPLMGFAPFFIILILFYFMLMRPQQQKLKKHKAMLEALKKGDRVVTRGGLHGLVVNVAKDVITLQVADNVRVRVTRGAVEEFQSEDEARTI